MKDNNEINIDWEGEFLDFVNSDPVSPPGILKESVTATVYEDLRPSIWKIFSKLAGLQAAWATLTLFVCPQFEVGFTKHDHLADLVQHSGGFGFMIICGMIFLSGGALIAPFFLKQVEMKAIERSVLLYFPTVALLAVLLFYSLGADINTALALPWFLGGVLGSVIGFELATFCRFRLRHFFISSQGL